jgi:hypothetical protein
LYSLGTAPITTWVAIRWDSFIAIWCSIKLNYLFIYNPKTNDTAMIMSLVAIRWILFNYILILNYLLLDHDSAKQPNPKNWRYSNNNVFCSNKMGLLYYNVMVNKNTINYCLIMTAQNSQSPKTGDIATKIYLVAIIWDNFITMWWPIKTQLFNALSWQRKTAKAQKPTIQQW